MAIEGIEKAQQYARPAALSILRNYVDDVEDVLQNAAIKAMRFKQAFKGKSQFRVWFTRIVINESLMFLRTKKKEFVSLDEENDDGTLVWDLPSPGASPEQETAWAEIRRVIDDEVSKMSLAHRIEFSNLLVGEGPGTNGTQKSRRFRVRKYLKKRLIAEGMVN